MATDTGYTEARAISEGAREKEWKLPSFGKGLYLGDFQPELISPQPELPAAAVEKGERFLAALRAFLEYEVDPQQIEREGRISDEVIAGRPQGPAHRLEAGIMDASFGDGPMVPSTESDKGIPVAAPATMAGSAV